MAPQLPSILVVLVTFLPQIQVKLTQNRVQIDQIDRQIVALLNQRAAVVARIGDLKKEANLPVAAPAREEQVLNLAVENGKAGPLPPAAIRRIYQVILNEMRTWEESRNAK